MPKVEKADALQTRRSWYWANRERARERGRRYYQANKEVMKARARRGRMARHELVAELLHEQGGCCYLCEKLVSLDDAHLDHDHRCCPPLAFCSVCVRGVSHPLCNLLIGHSHDDPDLLEVIARNLRAKLAEIDTRISAGSQQLSLDDVAL